MPAPPRWQVLTEAERIVAEALKGDSFEARRYRFQSGREQVSRSVADAWAKARLNPFFKLGLFYLCLILVSALVSSLQQKRRRKA